MGRSEYDFPPHFLQRRLEFVHEFNAINFNLDEIRCRQCEDNDDNINGNDKVVHEINYYLST